MVLLGHFLFRKMLGKHNFMDWIFKETACNFASWCHGLKIMKIANEEKGPLYKY